MRLVNHASQKSCNKRGACTLTSSRVVSARPSKRMLFSHRCLVSEFPLLRTMPVRALLLGQQSETSLTTTRKCLLAGSHQAIYPRLAMLTMQAVSQARYPTITVWVEALSALSTKTTLKKALSMRTRHPSVSVVSLPPVSHCIRLTNSSRACYVT